MNRALTIGGILVAWLIGGGLGHAAAPASEIRSLRLQECVRIALEQSPRITIARENVVGAQANLRKAYSSYLPQATFSTAHGRSGGVSFLETSAGQVPISSSALRHDADLLLSQVFWQTGRRQLLEQAKASYHGAGFDQESTRQSVIQGVAQAYYAALAARSLVEVARAALQASQGSLELVRARVEVGETARVDLAPAEADVANAEFQLIQAENNAEVAHATLKSQMGVSPTFVFTLADSFSPGQMVVPSLTEMLATAYATRPEILSSKAAVHVSLQAYELAQVNEGPVISLAGQYDEGLSGSSERVAWNITAAAQVFLFDGGARKADVTAARANLGAAIGQYEEALSGVGLDVETARLGVQTAEKSVDAASKSLTRAESQLAAAEGKYREGVGIYLEITQAQSAVTQARIDRVQAVLNYHTALVSLQRAIGALTPATLPSPGGGT